jgi:hypothetical protein
MTSSRASSRPAVPTPPTERLLTSLEALRSTELLDGAGEPRDGDAQALLEEDDARPVATGSEVVEQAKGVLVLRYGIDPGHAFTVLSAWSREADLDVHTIADTLVTAVCQGEQGRGYDGTLVRWLEEHLRRNPE